MSELRLLEEWHEDIGDVLWWKFPIEEAPYCGTPNDVGYTVLVEARTSRDQKEHELPNMRVMVGGWPGYHTHWTRFEVPEPMSDTPFDPDEATEQAFDATVKEMGE